MTAPARQVRPINRTVDGTAADLTGGGFRGLLLGGRHHEA